MVPADDMKAQRVREKIGLHSFLTSIVHGLIGRLHVPAALSPDRVPSPFEYKPGWASVPLWTLWR